MKKNQEQYSDFKEISFCKFKELVKFVIKTELGALSSNLVIWGTGTLAQSFIELLEEYKYLDKVTSFCDSFEHSGSEPSLMFNLPVINYKIAIQKYPKATYFLATSFQLPVANQLFEDGLLSVVKFYANDGRSINNYILYNYLISMSKIKLNNNNCSVDSVIKSLFSNDEFLLKIRQILYCIGCGNGSVIDYIDYLTFNKITYKDRRINYLIECHRDFQKFYSRIKFNKMYGSKFREHFINFTADVINHSNLDFIKKLLDINVLLTVNVIKGNKIRIGRHFDGGYIMMDSFQHIKAAYSFGISDDVSWDETIAKKNIPVFMYDHTIDCLPKDNKYFYWSKIGIRGNSEIENCNTLTELLKFNNHDTEDQLILKMDVESSEWDALDSVDSCVLNQFSQIVIELHDLLDPDLTEKIIRVLKKITSTHMVMHVHPNNYALPPLSIFGCNLYHVLEVTFVRKQDFSVDRNHMTLNTCHLDEPCAPYKVDYL